MLTLLLLLVITFMEVCNKRENEDKITKYIIRRWGKKCTTNCNFGAKACAEKVEKKR